jgi:hypothetical protein
MTSHVGRLYALALALLVFFLSWAAVAAHPWAATAEPDPRVAALVAREQRVRREAVVVRRIVRHRWAVYRRDLHRRRSQIAAAKRAQVLAAAAAPPVRIVNLPPLTVTRTS